MFHEVLKKPVRLLFRCGVVVGIIGLVLAFIWFKAGVPFLLVAMFLLSLWAGMSYADRAIYKAVTRKLEAKPDDSTKAPGS